jgi:uncharacterized protein (TIGR00369 family)
MPPRDDIERFMRGKYTLVGFSKLFGYYPVAWEPGKFEIHWEATDAFTTGQIPVIHGGALAALLDNVMGWATLSLLDDSENFATADLQIQFVRGAKPGLLKAQGSVVRRTRALAFCQSEVWNSEGQLVARGSATCSIFKAA